MAPVSQELEPPAIPGRFSDLFPHGPLRIVAGIETLNGFILIGWSASFTYLSMEKF
jgi:hypothetical protein